MPVISLSLLGEGRQGTITSIELPLEYKRRLSDLGFVIGRRICVAHIAPSGSPIAYCIKGTTIALRVDDSTHIRVYVDESV